MKLSTFKINYFSAKDTFKCTAIFDKIEAALTADGEALVNKVKGVFAFKVKDANGNEGVWIVDAKNGKGSVQFGGNGKKFELSSFG